MLAVNSDAFRRRQTSIVKKYFYQLVKQCTRLKKAIFLNLKYLFLHICCWAEALNNEMEMKQIVFVYVQ